MLKNSGLENTKFDQLPQKIKQEIRTSRQHYFNLSFYNADYCNITEKNSIQATFWSLSLEEVIKVDAFIACRVIHQCTYLALTGLKRLKSQVQSIFAPLH